MSIFSAKLGDISREQDPSLAGQQAGYNLCYKKSGRNKKAWGKIYQKKMKLKISQSHIPWISSQFWWCSSQTN